MSTEARRAAAPERMLSPATDEELASALELEAILDTIAPDIDNTWAKLI